MYRASRDAARAYRDAVSAVRAGECVGIYPEGTITKDPDLWPMIGRLAGVALETGCPVIPIAQWGPQETSRRHLLIAAAAAEDRACWPDQGST